MKVQLIYNPASGTHSDLRLGVLTLAFEACGAEVAVSQTNIDGSVAFERDSDLICVSGGDGALRLVAAAAVEAGIDIPFCTFPSGTVNLIAKEIGYPAVPDKFASQVMKGLIQGDEARLRAPVVTCNGSAFVACLSAGPDGLAVAEHSPGLKKRIGGAAYAVAALKLLWQWPRFHFELSAGEDGPEALSCQAFYIAKGYHFAGDWTLAREASLESDQFHLVALRTAGRRDYLRFIMRIALGRDLVKLPFIDTHACTTLTIRTHSQGRTQKSYQVDGDALADPPQSEPLSNEGPKRGRYRPRSEGLCPGSRGSG